MTEAGWIIVARSADDHPCLRAFDARGVWEKLLLMAAYKAHRTRLSGQWVELRRGQLAASVSSLAEEGGITRKRMRTILSLFARSGMVEMVQAKGHAFTVITVCNYDLYQVEPNGEGHPNGQARAKLGPSSGQQREEKEEDTDSSLRSESSDAQRPRPAARKVALGTKLPKTWRPSEEDRAYARKHGFTEARIDRIAENFVNYWIGIPGKAGLKLDWPATWRNRILQIVEHNESRGLPATGSRRSYISQVQDALSGDDDDGGYEAALSISGPPSLVCPGRTYTEH